jgi:two-component system response regulator MprA
MRGASKPVKVVVVDDEPSVTRYCRRVLELSGYDVSVANNGKDGIERVLEAEPEVVVLDVMMPVVQGYDVCRYIKSRLPSVKVVIISALSSDRDVRWGMDAGADAYLPKPFDPSELRETVSNLLEAPPR